MFEEDIHNLSVDSVRQKPNDFFGERQIPDNRDFSRPVLRQPQRDRVSRKLALPKKKFWTTLALLLASAALVYGIFNLTAWGGKIFGKNPFSFIASFGQLLTAGDKKLEGESEGEVNILLLGIGGAGHQGSLLTDTMILATIRPDSDQGTQIALLAIPRDYAVKLPVGSDLKKINSAYAYGEMKKEGLGAEWALQVMGELTGKNIPYYALVDFAGFKQAVDDLGGIDVNVENAFTDSAYPDSRYGYLPAIKFEKGLQHMDGERALQFSRSRHGTNGEGSDFSRGRRQQQILAAIKDKVAKLHFGSDLGTINRLLTNFADHFKTNLEPWEAKRLYDLTKDASAENILSVSLDPETGLICSDIDDITGAYVLIPCWGKTQQDIHQFAAEVFENGWLIKESAKIQFQNGTKVPSLAQRAAIVLIPFNQGITAINYPGKEQLVKTVIYDFSNGQKPKTHAYLKSKLNAVEGIDYPYLKELVKPEPDFVVVLGADVQDKFPPLPVRPPAVPEPGESDAAGLQKKATTTKP
ncbi:MAG: LCP family protein [Patescibacteria group bacterium]